MEKFRGRGRKGRGNRDRDRDFNYLGSVSNSNRPNHPKHLRGRDIGLYYAKVGKERREKNIQEIAKPICTVLLSESRKFQIQTLLHNVSSFNVGHSSNEGTETTTYIEDPVFKKEFLKINTGTIEDKLNKYTNDSLKKKPLLDFAYYDAHVTKTRTNNSYKEMLYIRKKLPSYDMRDEILQLVKKNQVIVISGETGCGKTTQIAQFILDDYILSRNGSICKIVCTQPRRISAISVAERVAQERGEDCGASSVGYQIRLEKKLPRSTGSITYCTTGVLLQQMQTDPALSDISHLILDEIHERDVVSDFVITVMKAVIAKRRDLKLILMSATLNAEQFAKYYNYCAIITIPGFTHPVTLYYLEDALAKTKYNFPPVNEPKNWRKHMKHEKDKQRQNEEFVGYIAPYVRSLRSNKKYSNQVCNNLLNPNSEKIDTKLQLELLKYICSQDDDGSILVFLPGLFEIINLNKEITNSKCFPPHKYLILILHSKLPSIQQRKVFDRPPKGVRKIVLATNIAETSITIDDIIYVIDCAKIKIKTYDVENDLEALNNEWVSVANANQRKGRAGRVQPGVCYHLFAKPRLHLIESYPKPEVQRSRLDNIILTVKILQLGKAADFLSKLMDPPDPKSVENAIRLLKHMNALDAEEYLTPLGYHLAILPINPRMGKMILLGALFSCLDPILSIATSLDFKDAFQYPIDKSKEVNERKKELSLNWKSDHLILAEAIKQYELAKVRYRDRDFCRDYFLSRYTLELLCQMKDQFAYYLYDMKFISNKNVKSEEWNQNSKNSSLIKAIVCASLYPNVAIIRKVNKRGMKLVNTTSGEKVQIHKNSVNDLEYIFESPLIVYYLKQKVLSTINLYDTTMVHPLPLLFFGDEIKIENNDESQNESNGFSIISLSNILRFKCKTDTAVLIKELRKKLDDLLKYKIANPGCIRWLQNDAEVKVLRAIMELITSEDLGEFDIPVEEFDD